MAYMPKTEKPKADIQIVEDYLKEGKSVDADMLSEREHDIRNLSSIIGRLKKKYAIDTSSKVGKKGKKIAVYTMPF